MFLSEAEKKKINSRILDSFTPIDLEYLYSLVYLHSIADNNIKADMISKLIGPTFEEIGTGTNRYCVTKDGYVWKFAMDNRGIIDNVSEFNRSQELSDYYCTETYETNGLITIAEYAIVMEESEFTSNIPAIRMILDDISQSYIIGDLGLTTKNFCNYGYRQNQSIVMIDYAYMYPISGNEDAMICPRCKEPITYTKDYNGFICSNTQCGTRYNFIDIRRRMNRELEDIEFKQFSEKPGKRIHTEKEILEYIERKQEMI